MEFVTNEKLTIVGAAGMIGSNMAQTAIMMGLTPNICLYDPYAPGLEGVAEELYHCGFEGVNVTFTSDIKEALTGAKYIVNSGGAARKAGMTREDLLKGNAAIAEEFGKNVKQYCPDVKHIVVIFIINLRGRSSFQSPSYVSIEMIGAAMGGKAFRWPAGTYVSNDKYDHIMMAWETSITADGCHCAALNGTAEEQAALDKSYEHLCALRDEVIAMGVLPPVSEWNKLNPNIK